MNLSEITIYPVKSLRGSSVAEARIERRGLEFDRRWLVVDAYGQFLTQREHPMMATVSTAIANGRLVLRNGEKSIEVSEPSDRRATVAVWNDVCQAAVCSDDVGDWLSDVLKVECRLVAMPESTHRPVDRDYAVRPDDHVSFADAFPFLLIGRASLDDLNRRLENPVPMDRFRPNLVIGGAEAFAEDGWKRIRVGEAEFEVVKPCSRCVMTTIDQRTGEKTGVEPLRTLASYRTVERNGAQKILFGQNLISGSAGSTVRVGDTVEILD